jgi:hypothetical protein
LTIATAFEGRIPIYAAIDPFSEGRFTSCSVAKPEMLAGVNISVRAMSDTSMTSHINRAARRFGGANHGNVAVILP